MVDVLLDTYSESNYDTLASLKVFHPSSSASASAFGQSFTTPNDGKNYKITSCKFYMSKTSTPSGIAHAVLYAHSGSYGGGGVPTGGALATSDDFEVSGLGALAVVTFTFSGAQQYVMDPNTHYCIIFQNPASGTIDSTHYVNIGYDTSTPNHSGNRINYFSSGWHGWTDDCCFYVYGVLASNSYSHTFNEKLGLKDSKARFKTMTHTFSEKLGIKDTPKWVLSGLLKDASGNLLVGAVALLYKASNNAYVDYTYSDANGVYTFSGLDHATQYFVVAFKPGAPDIQGCTDKGITAGVFNNS